MYNLKHKHNTVKPQNSLVRNKFRTKWIQRIGSSYELHCILNSIYKNICFVCIKETSP